MNAEEKLQIRKKFGKFLAERRVNELQQPNRLQFAYGTYFDDSKLRKIENGEVNFGFDNLIELAIAYQLTEKEILGFHFSTNEE